MGDINVRAISTFMVRRDNKEWRKGRDQQGTEKGNQMQKDDNQDSEVLWEARKAMRSGRPEGQRHQILQIG